MCFCLVGFSFQCSEIITVRNSSCRKVMFSQVSVILLRREGGVCGRHMHGRGCAWHGGHAWQGVCGKGACVTRGVHGREACMVGGMHDRRACMARGVHGRGHEWWGACMVGSVHGWGACMAGGHALRGGGHAWQERQPLQWTVRILLEYILVNGNSLA